MPRRPPSAHARARAARQRGVTQCLRTSRCRAAVSASRGSTASSTAFDASASFCHPLSDAHGSCGGAASFSASAASTSIPDTPVVEGRVRRNRADGVPSIVALYCTVPYSNGQTGGAAGHTGKKKPGGAGTHGIHGDTRAGSNSAVAPVVASVVLTFTPLVHTGTRISQINLTTIPTHQRTRTARPPRARRPNPRPTQQPQPRSRPLLAADSEEAAPPANPPPLKGGRRNDTPV